MDMELLQRLRPKRILTLEEHLRSGGFGNALLDRLKDPGSIQPEVRLHAIPDTFVEHAPQAAQRAGFGLDVTGVVAAVLHAFPELGAKAKLAGGKSEGSKEPRAPEPVTW